jgi:hypothetical protein
VVAHPPTFPVRLEDWEGLTEVLPRPWTPEAALVDLRYWTRKGRIPAREDLADRWGWDTARTGELVADRACWLDRSLPPPELPPGEIVLVRPRGKPRYKPSTDRPTHLHLDTRYKEVLAVARSHPEYREALQLGWERDDLDQELVARLAEKQELPGSTYDPTRSGFGKYTWTSTRSVLQHLIEMRRTSKVTQITTGVRGCAEHGDPPRDCDAAEIAVADLWDPAAEFDERRESHLALVAPLRRDG